MTARILVIEDHPANLQLMTYLLQAHGFECPTATDGAAGIEAATRARPQLIVCDIQLPVFDGFEVLRRLRSEADLRAIPVVAVTAFARAEDERRIRAAGFDGYLTKPIDPPTFIQSLRQILDRGVASGRPAAPDASRRTIVVVDDNRVNLDFAKALLEGSGHVVLTASTSSEGLLLARNTPPDLIVSDVEMGSGSGFELLVAAKTDPLLRDIPFVFVTSTRTSASSRREGLALGATKYLIRPIEPQVLLRELESCLGPAANS